MTNQVFDSNRRFQVWSYEVGHGLLLLRSTKNVNNPTQVDLLFTNVAFLSLPVLFDGICISIASIEEMHKIVIQTAELQVQNRKCYYLAGQNWIGCVVAEEVTALEDSSSYFERSALLPRVY